MGFTTGFLGGITLTYSVIYLSVYVHRQNRTHQSLLLRQQARLLDSKVDGPEPEYEPPTYRTEKAGLEEQLKDRWNRELESNVRKLQETDWEAFRIRWENRVSHVFNKIRNTEQVQEAEQKVIQTATEIKDTVVDQAAHAKHVAVEQAAVARQTAIEQATHAKHKIAEQAALAKGKAVEQAAAAKQKAVEQATLAKQKAVEQAAAAKQAVKQKTSSAKEDVREAVGAQRLLEVKI